MVPPIRAPMRCRMYMPILRAELPSLRNEAHNLDNQSKSIRAEIAQHENEVKKIKAQIDDINKQITQCGQNMAPLYSLVGIGVSPQSMDQSAESADDPRSELKADLQIMREHNKNLASRRDELKKNCDSIEVQIEMKRASLHTLETKYRTMQDDIEQREARLNDMQTISADLIWLQKLNDETPSKIAAKPASWLDFQRKNNTPVRDNRPNTNAPFPVELSFPIFGKFINDCVQIAGKIMNPGNPRLKYSNYSALQNQMSDVYEYELSNNSQRIPGRQELLQKTWNAFFRKNWSN